MALTHGICTSYVLYLVVQLTAVSLDMSRYIYTVHSINLLCQLWQDIATTILTKASYYFVSTSPEVGIQVDMQVDMLLAALSPKQPSISIPVATTGVVATALLTLLNLADQSATIDQNTMQVPKFNIKL